jgi:Arc/MetJ family transcription regulator
VTNTSHRILDTETGKQYAAKAAAGRDLAHLVNGDPKDQFVYFQIARTYPDRFRVLNEQGEWVRLDDPSAPVGTLRPNDPPAGSRGGTRVTTLVIDERKYAEAKEVLGTSTLKETVDRSFDHVLMRAARTRSIERLRKMDGIDLDKRSVMDKAWR